ncbi:MAG TPA: glycosyltransferase [Candidatus Paceibacterota bacterium]|jgi:glycosyltransferase involved in cell wall biosynthesis|nr:glycosyltransferase [Candidatus Paceibacterota bacterium]
MKILYLANIRLPTEKAHGFQIVRTCDALARAGNEVTLVVSSCETSGESEIFAHYELQKTFNIKTVKGIQLHAWGTLGFFIAAVLFRINTRSYVSSGLFDVVYTRDEWQVRRGSIFEMHDVRKGIVQRKALKIASGIVAITQGLSDYCAKMGVGPDKVAIVPDAVDPAQFQVNESKEACRAKLGLPLDKKMVLYTGHLYSWKGADTLAQATAMLSVDTCVVFVGGTDSDLKSFKNKYESAPSSDSAGLLILGRKPHVEIAYYFKAADVLILPNSAKEDISRLYTSPIKLFEYMSSGTPIIASDLPSIREVLNENNAYFFEADNASSLAQAIKSTLDNSAEATIIAARASADVHGYTWEKRAAKILSFISRIQCR